MSWLDFFQTTQSTCNISFGRGINADISPEEEELFFKAYEAFEKKDIFNAYEYFLSSLINHTDENSNENISFERSENELSLHSIKGLPLLKQKLLKKNFMLKRQS